LTDTIKHTIPKADTAISILSDTTVKNNVVQQFISDSSHNARGTSSYAPQTATDANTQINTLEQVNPTNNRQAVPDKSANDGQTGQSEGYTRLRGVFNDSVSIMPDALFSMYEQADTLAIIEPYEADPSEVYGSFSIKNNNELETREYTASTVGHGNTIQTQLRVEWLDAVSLGLIIYFTLVLIFTRRFLSSLPLFNWQNAHKQFEENSQSSSYSRRLYLFPSILIFSTYLLFTRKYISPVLTELPLFKLFVLIIIVLAIIAVIKQFFLWLTGYVTLSQSFVSELLFNRQIILIAASIFLFPIAVLLPLYHENDVQNMLLIIGLSIIALAFIGTLIRSLMLFRSSRVSLFLWILYLCILEIAPYLALSILFQ
jgi:hypothetical protein